MSQIIPVPRVPLNIRPATMDDLSFLDGLQKTHSRQLGYFPTRQFQGYIEMGGVLVAEATERRSDEATEAGADDRGGASLPFVAASLRRSTPLGYLIWRDRYLKRDELGVIYQLCVEPGHQRGFIGAALVQAAFDRSAYGCKLFCCWCAQDIEANYFWEAMGFVPIAFRTGSLRRGSGQTRIHDPSVASSLRRSVACPRVHIFWQKRIRAGDTSTPWWFPAKTEGGAIREDRIVLPIPPGVRWSDVMPLVLPGDEKGARGQADQGRALERSGRKAKAAETVAAMASRGLWFGPAKEPPAQASGRRRRSALKRSKSKVKSDPRLVAAARELRDRWLEQVNSGQCLPQACEKYHVARQIEAVRVLPIGLLEAA